MKSNETKHSSKLFRAKTHSSKSASTGNSAHRFGHHQNFSHRMFSFWWSVAYPMDMKTKRVRGIGIYEKGLYQCRMNGKPTKEYQLWDSMIHRCSPDYQTRMPSYLGVTVHPDFIRFQDFAAWCHKQIGFSAGYELDKDILSSGNKVYGPDTCCFVPKKINMMLTHNQSTNKGLPVGVLYLPKPNKYRAAIRHSGKTHHLGLFDTPELASYEYRRAKRAEIYRQAALYRPTIDPKVFKALISYPV